MKKGFILLCILSFATVIFAQKPSLTKAYNSFYDKDFDKAKTQIDLCTADEKLSMKAQTWLYKGNIEFLLANREYTEKQKNENYIVKYPNAPEEAYDAFSKALQINPKVEALDMMSAKEALAQLYPYLLIEGVDQLIANKLSDAKRVLEKGISSYEMDKPQYPMNGDLYYYYAYTLEMLGDTNNMIKNYKKAFDDGSQNAYVYAKLIDYYKKNNLSNEALQTLDNAKKNNPNNLNIKLVEIDYLYWTGDSLKATKLLDEIHPSSLSNVDEMVNVANFYIKEKRYSAADNLLAKANAISPNNFVILYNLGVCNYSMSEYYFNQQNQLAIKQANPEQVKQAKEEYERHLQKSVEYFEKAQLQQPEDLNLLNALRAIYVRQQSPKADEIDKKIKKLEINN